VVRCSWIAPACGDGAIGLRHFWPPIMGGRMPAHGGDPMRHLPDDLLMVLRHHAVMDYGDVGRLG